MTHRLTIRVPVLNFYQNSSSDSRLMPSYDDQKVILCSQVAIGAIAQALKGIEMARTRQQLVEALGVRVVRLALVQV